MLETEFKDFFCMLAKLAPLKKDMNTARPKLA